MDARIQLALEHCRRSLPQWADVELADVDWSPPKGFSSFTAVLRAEGVQPHGVLYRRLAGKENQLLDYDDERRVYLALADAGVAAPCLAYERDYRIEELYEGRTLTRENLREPSVLRGIGEQLALLHSVEVEVPNEEFFARLHRRWMPLARRTLMERRNELPRNEQEMCQELAAVLDPDVLARVATLLPDRAPGFCHNDTYQGNIMRLDSGEIRLLDFEFSCLNHRSFDFSNLFAETVMRHGLPEDPHFDIAEPAYTAEDVAVLVASYVENSPTVFGVDQLVNETLQMVPLSDFMYAMAAIPLALAPIQKLRFIPYALRRWRRFVAAT